MPASTSTVPRLLRLPEVLQVTGLGRDSIYRLANKGQFPRPRKLTPRSSAWLESDITAWIESRPVAGTDDTKAA